MNCPFDSSIKKKFKNSLCITLALLKIIYYFSSINQYMKILGTVLPFEQLKEILLMPGFL